MLKKRGSGRMKKINNKVGIILIMLTLLCFGVNMPLQIQAAEAAVNMVSSEAEIILKNTEGKNASDVAAIKELLYQQKVNGVDVSAYENLDDGDFYRWSEDGRLIILGIYLKRSAMLMGFENIELINIYGSVTELYVEKCPKLTELNIYSDKLRELDTSGCHNLKRLDISKCLDLKEIYCSENSFTELDITKYPKLEGLYCNGNKLRKLDLSKCPKLRVLTCGGNKLRKLDLSKCPKLAILGCDNNKLTKLDISKCPKLAMLDCANNKLRKLDLSKCSKIEILYADKRLTVPGWSPVGKEEIDSRNVRWVWERNKKTQYIPD